MNQHHEGWLKQRVRHLILFAEDLARWTRLLAPSGGHEHVVPRCPVVLWSFFREVPHRAAGRRVCKVGVLLWLWLQGRNEDNRQVGSWEGIYKTGPDHPDACPCPRPHPSPLPPKLEPKNQSIISHSRPCNHIHPHRPKPPTHNPVTSESRFRDPLPHLHHTRVPVGN